MSTLLRLVRGFVVAGMLAVMGAPVAMAQSGSTFTYQGLLKGAGGTPVNQPTTLRFQLFGQSTGGSVLAGPVTVANVPVQDGLFRADVDFGNAFTSGRNGWLEVAVVEGSTVTVLSPRQRIGAAPLAAGIVGVPIEVAAPRVDVLNNGTTTGSTGLSSLSPTSFYFVIRRTGVLEELTVNLSSLGIGGNRVVRFEVFQGLGTGGLSLGSVERSLPAATGPWTVNLSSLNIGMIAGRVYTVGMTIVGIPPSPAPRIETMSSGQPSTGAFDSTGQAIHVPFVVRLRTNRVGDASWAALAETADRARSFDPGVPSGLNGIELRMRGASDSNHGIGWFGGTQTFRNTSFAPDGPVLFGLFGGGLGTTDGPEPNIGVVALRWNSAGNVGIGTAAPGTAGFRLELPNIAGPAGQGRANAWVTYSSQAYKQEIETLPDAIATLQRLRGVQFVWKEPLADGTHKHDIGFIAEEVAAAVPELATLDEAGHAAGLDYGKVVPITVEAIKAQQEVLKKQEALLKLQQERIEAMEAQNAALLRRLEALEGAGK